MNPMYDMMPYIPSIESSNYALLGLGFFFFIFLFALILSIVIYVLTSVGLMRCASKLGFRMPGLAFLPIYNSYLTGKIAERHACGKKLSHLKIVLLIGHAATMLFSVLLNVIYIFFTIQLSFNETIDMESLLVFSGFLIIFGIFLTVISIVYLVFHYIALYHLYSMFNPKNKVLFLVLSIVFPVTVPFFLFACGKSQPVDYIDNNGNVHRTPPPMYGYPFYVPPYGNVNYSNTNDSNKNFGSTNYGNTNADSPNNGNMNNTSPQ